MAEMQQWPGVRSVSVNDLIDIMAAGIRDFRAAPQYGLFFGGLYAGAGWLLILLLWVLGLPFLAYPLAMGFALISPFAAVGFYAISEHLEKGKPLTWPGLFAAVWEAAHRDLRWMALITGFALFIWLDIAAILFFSFMGMSAFEPGFLDKLFTTPTGIVFLLVGNTSGALIAMLVFSISVVSFPMLYDRDVDFVTAMVTSVRLVIANPATMIVWCAVIGVLTGLSLLAAFLGLLVVLPVIGHATWHLYRRAVEPAAAAAAEAAA